MAGGVVTLHGIGRAVSNMSQVDQAASAAGDAAYKAVLAKYGIANNQSAPKNVTDEAAAAAQQASQAATAAATAAGLSTAAGSAGFGSPPASAAAGGSAAPVQASVAGMAFPAQHKAAVEVGLGLVGVILLWKLLAPKAPSAR